MLCEIEFKSGDELERRVQCVSLSVQVFFGTVYVLSWDFISPGFVDVLSLDLGLFVLLYVD